MPEGFLLTRISRMTQKETHMTTFTIENIPNMTRGHILEHSVRRLTEDLFVTKGVTNLFSYGNGEELLKEKALNSSRLPVIQLDRKKKLEPPNVLIFDSNKTLGTVEGYKRDGVNVEYTVRSCSKVLTEILEGGTCCFGFVGLTNQDGFLAALVALGLHFEPASAIKVNQETFEKYKTLAGLLASRLNVLVSDITFSEQCFGDLVEPDKNRCIHTTVFLKTTQDTRNLVNTYYVLGDVRVKVLPYIEDRIIFQHEDVNFYVSSGNNVEINKVPGEVSDISKIAMEK